jgi:signal transduction histidine kinase
MDGSAVARANWSKLRGRESWLAPVAVALAYFAAAHVAFLIGTLSDEIFAPFWPPNAILFCGLLLTRPKRWWSIIAATLPAHILAEQYVGMAAVTMGVAFITNCALAVLNAAALLWLSSPPWFGSLRKAAIFIAAIAGINPAVVAIGGALVPALGVGSLHDYQYFWATWYLGNALACLTISPIILSWIDSAGQPLWSFPGRRHIEPALFALALTVITVISLEASVRWTETAFGPAILYLPLPIILWGAVRFGERGASAAILILTVASIFQTLNGHSPFTSETPERSVLALQLFLFGVAVPVLFLSAAVDQLRNAQQAMRVLTGSLLKAQDDERRRIARDLHDSTAQNLVAASLLERDLADALPEPLRQKSDRIEAVLQQSIGELRLLSYLLHPPHLDEGGLGPALRSYAAGFSERTNVEIDLQISDEFGRLPEGTEIALYRVVQEALTNVDRHSGSRSATIRLNRRRRRFGHFVKLAIEDRGKGFAISQESKDGSSKRGVGLDSMRERFFHMGGRLWIHSEPGRTVVRGVVPVE